MKVAKRGVKVEVCTMEPDAGKPSPERTPIPPRRPPARSPLVPGSTGKRIRSAPTVLPPREGGKPARLPLDAPEPKRRFNRLGIILALVICVGTIPFTYQFQKNRFAPKSTDQKTNYEIPPEQRQWRMKHLEGLTEKQATDRFGTPYVSRNFNMSDGSFAGPAVGLKRFYRKTLPEYETLTKDAEALWSFPQYVVIRELVWQFPDSYLYIWMREPRAEIDISDDSGIVALPTAPDDGGDWVVIDNFRLGKDLVKAPPASSPTPPEKTP